MPCKTMPCKTMPRGRAVPRHIVEGAANHGRERGRYRYGRITVPRRDGMALLRHGAAALRLGLAGIDHPRHVGIVILQVKATGVIANHPVRIGQALAGA